MITVSSKADSCAFARRAIGIDPIEEQNVNKADQPAPRNNLPYTIPTLIEFGLSGAAICLTQVNASMCVK